MLQPSGGSFSLLLRLKDKPGQDEEEIDETEQLLDDLNLDASRRMMEAWLKEADLDPDAKVTRKGFLRLFSAWVLDESLPWTTGEAPSLRLLFSYLKVKQQLPSDTAVRNQLAHIFNELHASVVKAFAVR